MNEESKFYKKTIIISLVIFLIVSISFFLIGDITIKKIDEILGMKESNIIVDKINKNFFDDSDNIKLTVNFITKISSTTYIKVGDIRSESSYGKNFSKVLILDKSYIGKGVNLTIISIDDNNNQESLVKEIFLPKRMNSDIRITG